MNSTIIITVVIGLIILMFIRYYNQLKQMQIKVEEAKSGIDVALEKRYDTLTKMFDVAKSYAKFEKNTLVEIVKYRSKMNVAEMNSVQSKLNAVSKEINLVAEQYPQLQSNQQFVILQKQIADCEEHLQASRRLYNSNVSILNSKIVSFPTNLIASTINVKTEEFFVAEEEKRKDIKMDFNI